MDLRLHLMVIWRFRRIVFGGVLAAFLIAALVLFDPAIKHGPSLTPREQETWISSSTLLVTQEGFPWGRSVLPGVDPSAPIAKSPEAEGSPTRYADPARLSYLATIYSHFLTSDEVVRLIPDPPPGMSISAQTVKAGGNVSAADLPMIALEATADTPEGAARLTRTATEALKDYITTSQASENVPAGQRVELRVIKQTSDAVLVRGLPWSKAVVAFSFVLALAFALAYVLENLRPRSERLASLDAVLATDHPDFDADAVFDPTWEPEQPRGAYPKGRGQSYTPTKESTQV
jgi:hypothetical protein